MDTMKVCLHTNFSITPDYIGGTERFLITLSKELKCLGFEPFIVCSSFINEIMVEGIKVIGRIPEPYKPMICKYKSFTSAFLKNEIFDESDYENSLRRLSKYTEMQLAGIDADIFHLNSFASASFLPYKENYIVTNHENNKEYNGFWGENFFETFRNLVKNRQTELHKYPFLLVPSQFYSEYFSKQFNLNIGYIHLGINLNDFPIRKQLNDLKEEYFNHDDNGCIILFPSRFQIMQKGHDIAIKAAALLKEKGYKFKIIFTGLKRSNEKYIKQYEELIEQYDVKDCVVVTTFHDINTAYDNCDVVVSAEKYCSYGLSISESLSKGIPTILTNIPTYLEIANEYQHAIFFENENYEALSKELSKVISKPITRDVIGAIKFRSNNDLRECARKYAQKYIALLNHSSRHDDV